jgi:hypothetical protein
VTDLLGCADEAGYLPEYGIFLALPQPRENTKMPARKRELIEPHAGDKRYVRRDDRGQFKESDDVSRSLSQDVRRKASTVSKHGQGDRGDRK